MWEKNKRKMAFGRISWEKMLTNSRFVKKAVQFMKLFGLINQFRSAAID